MSRVGLAGGNEEDIGECSFWEDFPPALLKVIWVPHPSLDRQRERSLPLAYRGATDTPGTACEGEGLADRPDLGPQTPDVPVRIPPGADLVR